jgi:hypothetical protein
MHCVAVVPVMMAKNSFRYAGWVIQMARSLGGAHAQALNLTVDVI